MNRKATLLALVLAAAACPALAFADDAPPTQEQLDQAKKAFEEGNALYKAGKLPEAIEKLKESFRLSRNAFLLYNIGHSYDQLGQKDMVLFYYRKFLESAPANAPMRNNVQKRVTELEAENVVAATPDAGDAGNTAAATTPAAPTSKYSKADFKHDVVFTVPPSNPVDVTAFVPQDSGFTVKLFYRPAGEASFTSKPMTWRNMELVARIPAGKVTGSNVQYYLEVRDASNNLITRSGKSTSPNLVNIEQGAPPKYYADFVDEGGEVFVPVTVEEPLFTSDSQQDTVKTSSFGTVKWVTTAAAVGVLGTSFVSYIMAGKEHDKLVRDSFDCGTPPCRQFDAEFGHKVQDVGKRWDLTYKITLGVGITAAAVAGYFWYRDIKAKKRTPTSALMLVPTVTNEFAGATAAAEF